MPFWIIAAIVNAISLGFPVWYWLEMRKSDVSASRRPFRVWRWIVLVTSGCLLWFGSVVCVLLWHGFIIIFPVSASRVIDGSFR